MIRSIPTPTQTLPTAPREARPARRLSLPQGGLWSMTTTAPLVMTGARGLGWVTFEGDPVDHVLRPGGALHFPKDGRLVVQALRELDFDVAPL